MAEYEVTPVTSVLGTNATDDGQYVMIKLSHPDGSESILAFPHGELYRAIDGFASGLEQSRTNLGTSPQDRGSWPVSWFEIGRYKDGTPVLTLTFGGGGKLSFRFDMSMAERMHDALGILTGRSIPPTPDKQRH